MTRSMSKLHDEDAGLVEEALATPADLRPFETLVRRHEGRTIAVPNQRFLDEVARI